MPLVIRPLSLVRSSCWLAMAAIWISPPAPAAELFAELSRRETYVGLPVTLQIRIVDAQDYESPEIPDVDGLSIESLGSPSRSSSLSIINGRQTSSSSVSFGFRVTPQREGTFTIPPVSVVLDGRTVMTSPQPLVATKSETGDLLFVEVVGKQREIYVGQALDLTLKIWVRPYRDAGRDIVLSPAEMWNLISDQTTWGPFADRIRELAAEHKRPVGREVLRRDQEGRQRSYYLYEIDATLYPQRPGQIDSADLRVIVNYPTSLGKARDPFAEFFNDQRFPLPSRLFDDDFFSSRLGSRLTVQSVRPIVADAAIESIAVRPIPTAGRPDDYRGAVGEYEIVAEAIPTRVAAGDPITLNLGIVGDGPMEMVQAPPLAELAELTSDFKVPGEPLAGIVEGPQKRFTTTIRPRRAGITEIPPIPLSYFDPVAEKFVTVSSDPIPIEVSPSESLALDAIVAAQRSPSPGPAASATPERLAPLLDRVAGPEWIENQPLAVSGLSRAQRWAVLLPPLAALLVGLLFRRAALVAALERWRSPRRQLQAKLRRAEQPADVAAAMSAFVDRSSGNQSVGSDSVGDVSRSTTRLAALGRLRLAGHRAAAIELERFYDRCDQLDLESSSESLNELCQQALRLADDLHSEFGRSRGGRSVVMHRAGSIAILVVGTLSMSPVLATDSQNGLQPTVRELLQEANQAYETGRQLADPSADDAQRWFSTAADKYQWVVDAGVQDQRLYFNLGNAYLQSGSVGRAIANYYRALRIDPTWYAPRQNLAYAESLLNPASDAAMTLVGSDDWIGRIIDQLIRFVHPQWIVTLAVGSWVTVWVVVSLRLAGLRLAWKSLLSLALGLTLTAGSLALYLQRAWLPGSRGIVVTEQASLRAGDGENFPEVASLDASAGRHAAVLHRRGEWVQVRIGVHTGWLRQRALEVL